LRDSRSLAWSTQAALLLGVLAVLVQYVGLSDPAAFWQQQLEPMAQRFVDAGVFNQAQSVDAIKQLSGMMCGIVAAGFVLQLLLSLYLARWWQALLYNPGGFGVEFRQLRVHKVVGILGLAVSAVWLIPGLRIPGVLICIGAVLLTVFLLQGLAVAHGVFAGMKSPRRWLFGIYLLLVLFLPQVAVVLITVGLLDVWLDFRARQRREPNG
jgi:hypothetical protein